LHVDGRVGLTNGAADDTYVAETTAGNDGESVDGRVDPINKWRNLRASTRMASVAEHI